MGSTPRRVAAIALVLALAGTAFGTIALPAIRSPDRAIRDFSIDYAAARAWRDGGDPFASTSENVTRYVAPRTIDEPEWHTPLYVVVFVPLSYLPYRGAASAWALVSIAAMIAAGVVLARGLGFAGWWGALGGAAALFLPPVVADLGHGQMNCILVLLLVLSWRHLLDKPVAGTLALGAAAAIKIFPAVVILALIRRERTAGIRAIAWAGALTGAAVLLLGHIDSWIDAASHVGGVYATRPDNFSVTAVVARWIGTGPAMLILAAGAAAFLLLRPRDFWVGVLIALASWPVVWPHYIACVLPWAAVAIIRTDGRARVVAIAATSLFVAATLPGPWWTATVGSRAGLWWMAPLGSILAIAASLRSAGRLEPTRAGPALVSA